MSPVSLPNLGKPVPLVAGLSALGLFVVVLVAVVVSGIEGPLGVDHAWWTVIGQVRTPVGTAFAVAFDTVGGSLVSGIGIPVVVLIVLLLTGRRWDAAYLVAAVVLCAAAVQVTKAILERPRPGDILVSADLGSFPSGHSANAAVLVVVIVCLSNRIWTAVPGAVYLAAMMLSRTYVSAHWLTDVLGGAALGVAVGLLLRRGRFAGGARSRERAGLRGPGDGATAERRRSAGAARETERAGVDAGTELDYRAGPADGRP